MRAGNVSVHQPLHRCALPGAHAGHSWSLRSGCREQLSYCPGCATDGSAPLPALACRVTTRHHGHAWDPGDGSLPAGQLLLRWCPGAGPDNCQSCGPGESKPDLSITLAIADPGADTNPCQQEDTHTGHSWTSQGRTGVSRYWCTGLPSGRELPAMEGCPVSSEHARHVWHSSANGYRWCYGHGTAEQVPARFPEHPEMHCTIKISHEPHLWQSHSRNWWQCPGLKLAGSQVWASIKVMLNFRNGQEAHDFDCWWRECGALAWALHGDRLRPVARKDT